MVDERVAARVAELARDYAPPGFEEVPHPDAALFLTAVDHSSGYSVAHRVDGAGPFRGSALLWAAALAAERRDPGLLTAESLHAADRDLVLQILTVEGDQPSVPALRAELWRDAAERLNEGYGGEAASLIAAAGGRLAGPGGLLERLAELRAYSDPLQKKSFLVAKIWERRGWLMVADPESWQVSADNVLMRLALRSGLVEATGGAEELRAATRDAWKRVSEHSGVAPPVLDDLLWERGRDDPDLLGREAGDLREPPRPPGTWFY